jgi:hypothetical protein
MSRVADKGLEDLVAPVSSINRLRVLYACLSSCRQWKPVTLGLGPVVSYCLLSRASGPMYMAPYDREAGVAMVTGR